jgi:hypothetical protein
VKIKKKQIVTHKNWKFFCFSMFSPSKICEKMSSFFSHKIRQISQFGWIFTKVLLKRRSSTLWILLAKMNEHVCIYVCLYVCVSVCVSVSVCRRVCVSCLSVLFLFPSFFLILFRSFFVPMSLSFLFYFCHLLFFLFSFVLSLFLCLSFFLSFFLSFRVSFLSVLFVSMINWFLWVFPIKHISKRC